VFLRVRVDVLCGALRAFKREQYLHVELAEK